MNRRLKIVIALFAVPVVLLSFIVTGTGEQIVAGADVVFSTETSDINNPGEIDLYTESVEEVPILATPVE